MEARPRIHTSFGDEHSSLFDQFERLSVEIHLHKAILARSWSEPNLVRSVGLEAPPTALVSPVQQGRQRRPEVLPKILNKLLKLMRRNKGKREDSVPNHAFGCKIFSRSVSVSLLKI